MWARSVGRRLWRSRLVLATGLAAALPIIVTMVHVVAVGWAPLGDDAVVAVRAIDVLSSHPPLLGMPAGGATAVLREQAYHLGPLLFWLLALPARAVGPSFLPVTVGLVNVASVMGIVGLAHRRGGRLLMFAVAAAIPLMLASIPGAMHSAVWNPAAALLPFTLLIFLAWSVAGGEYRLLPVAVLAASFAAQCHLTYVVPSLAALAVGLVGLAAWLRSAEADAARGRVGRWVVAAALVGLLCWSGPLVQQATESPGNFTVLTRAGTANDPNLGERVGLRALVRAVGVPPWWLRPPRGSLQRIADVSVFPSVLTTGSAAAVIAALAAVTLAGWRRRRRDVVAAGALGLTLCVALGLAVSSVPSSAFATLGYGLWWASPAGMFVWLALGWSVATLLAGARRRAAAPLPARAAPAVLIAVVAVSTAVAVGADRRDDAYSQMRAVSDRLSAALPSGQPVQVEARTATDHFLAAGFQLGIVYALRHRGQPVTAPSVAKLLGSRYGRMGGDVVVVDVDRRPDPGARVIARVSADPRDPDNPFSKAPARRVITVSVARPVAGADLSGRRRTGAAAR
jgi:hypothetical protein